MVEGGFLGGLVCCAEDNHLAPQRGSGCTTIWIHLDGSFTFIPHVRVFFVAVLLEGKLPLQQNVRPRAL